MRFVGVFNQAKPGSADQHDAEASGLLVAEFEDER